MENPEEVVCVAICKSTGKRCKNKAKPGSDKCGVHAKAKGPEKWDVKGFPEPKECLKPAKVKTAISKMQRAKKTSPGYIYVFSLKRHPGYYKIGMTTRPVDKRLSEWKDMHPGERLVKVDVFETACPKELERVIHLYLDYIRYYLHVDSEGRILYFQKKRDKKDPGLSAHASVAMHKQIEWFKTDAYATDIKKVIQMLTAVVDNSDETSSVE